MTELNPRDTRPIGLCHYTCLSSLIAILETGELRLGDPAGWALEYVPKALKAQVVNVTSHTQVENEGKKGPWGPMTSGLIP